MLFCLLVDNEVTGEDLLEALPERANAAVNLLRLVLGELPGEIETIEPVGLDQRVGAIDEWNAGVAALQQSQIFGVLLLGNILIAADAQQNLKCRVLLLQAGHGAVQAAAQIQIKLLVGADQLVAAGIYACIAVDQMGAELHGRLQVIEGQLGKACGWNRDRQTEWMRKREGETTPKPNCLRN